MNNLIHKLSPFSDVHNHLHLSTSVKRFFEIYPDFAFQFPEAYNGLDDMIDFILNRFNTILKSGEDVVKLMNASILSSIDDNVTYLEASIDANLSRFFNGSIDALIYEVSVLKDTYKDQITFRPDIGINKSLSDNDIYTYTQACFDSNVFYGIDIYGLEQGQNLNRFKELYQAANAKQLKTKVHIGEFSDAESIKDAINILNPKELQHGINAVQSNEVMDMIIERNIKLNICPESNLKLGAVKSLEAHPMRKLFDKGIKITINTDDLILFHKTVSQQYQDLLDKNIFSIEELETIRKNGFD